MSRAFIRPAAGATLNGMTLDLTVPDLTGKLAIVTGAGDGLGRVLAGRLAAAGAELVLPVRDLAKAGRTLAHVPNTTLRHAALASLDDVAAFAKDVDRPVHILVNNAGIMAPPRRTTRDGLELQFATNHLSHFALVHHLLPRLKEGRARVTSVVRTPLDRWFKRLSRAGILVRTAERGARPAVYAATSPGARGGGLYGPGGPGHLSGVPVEQRLYRSARDPHAAGRIWALSEELVR